MTADRIKVLDSLGFDWKGSDGQTVLAEEKNKEVPLLEETVHNGDGEENSGNTNFPESDGSQSAANQQASAGNNTEGNHGFSGQLKLNTKVAKRFLSPTDGKVRSFCGSVRGYDQETRLYRVVYQDGDVEELT